MKPRLTVFAGIAVAISAQIRFRREQPPEKRGRDAIRAFAYELGLTLKKNCLLC